MIMAYQHNRSIISMRGSGERGWNVTPELLFFDLEAWATPSELKYNISMIKLDKALLLVQVALRLEEADIEHALQDKILLSSMLEQGIPSH